MSYSTYFDLINNMFYYYPKYPIQRNESFVSYLIKEYLPSEQKPIAYFNAFSGIFSDFIFICPAFEMAELYSKLGMQAYSVSHSYEQIISSSPFPKSFGAVHSDELSMLFADALSNKIPALNSGNYWSTAFHNYSNNQKKI